MGKRNQACGGEGAKQGRGTEFEDVVDDGRTVDGWTGEQGADGRTVHECTCGGVEGRTGAGTRKKKTKT